MSARPGREGPSPPAGPRPDPDSIGAIESGEEIELVVKASRFLGQAFRCDSEEEGRERLEAVRRRYHDATHHCWALRTGLSGTPGERWDDDGEPSGTAGLPILGAIRRSAVTCALVVVTRYYGGVKLGTGGLTRAYGEAGRQALLLARPRILWLHRNALVECGFEQIGAVETFLARHADAILQVQREFGAGAVFRLVIKESRAERLGAELVDACAGRLRLSWLPDPPPEPGPAVP